MSYLFTSESVSEGHPDKVCDRISDMVVDSYLSKDPVSRVACETLTTTRFTMLRFDCRKCRSVVYMNGFMDAGIKTYKSDFQLRTVVL